MAVVVRAVLLSSKEGGQMHNVLARMIDVTQVAHQTFSLLTNIFATSIIALKAWCVCVDCVFGNFDFILIDDMLCTQRKYRKLLIASEIGARYPSQAIRILALMVESGMLYILIGVSSTLVH
jgi:hypothetical protein